MQLVKRGQHTTTTPEAPYTPCKHWSTLKLDFYTLPTGLDTIPRKQGVGLMGVACGIVCVRVSIWHFDVELFFVFNEI